MGATTSFGNEQAEQVGTTALPSGSVPGPPRRLGFTRVPFSKNGRVHIESCCERCNFRILEWLDDFDDQERRHTAECPGPRAE
jgi:hypothetical protein